ncbi:hypothetical protein F4820DRAFT_416220 [Hypoxylon rubiginosum]|uniref:Uncharacterized protein n=1 Tax=Hypoxylon rubiginosum TaxID=110542 RepID=A0ACB9Z4D4_9PEZI|nr:hypothetical protein F4820DRAFT_416220 [Hypoxylon rubiginosum]
MKFQTPLLLLTSLLSYVSTNAADTTALEARHHQRDFVRGVSNNAARDIQAGEESYLSKRDPTLPLGKDDTKLHVWIRTDNRKTTYDARSGANHDGLNQLMKDTGGRHKDVVIGNKDGYWEYGLQFENSDWQTKPNGDGAPIDLYAGSYEQVPGGQETFQYRGQVGDGRKTLNTIKAVGELSPSLSFFNALGTS